MKTLIVLGAFVAGTAIVGCDEVLAWLEPPHPLIVAQRGTDGLAGFDYTANVFCTVRNAGGSGSVKITATFRQNGSWQRSETMPLAAGEERQVAFVFPEAELWSGKLTFSCDAKSAALGS